MNKIPLVAIVGRANVGKSSLFNMLVGSYDAIVAREPGTTRDPVWGKVETEKGVFNLVDTAGLKNPEDEFEASIQSQIEEATAAADLIIVVIDGSTMITEEDKRVAKLALKSKKPVILAVNKVDKVKNFTPEEYLSLGIKEIVGTSTTQKIGVSDLIDAIYKYIPKVKPQPEGDTLPIALVGRPNVGKSSLFNAIAKKQQALVADVAGTTRDVNRVEIKYKGQKIILLDTAGIRKSGKIQVGIEKFSVLRAIRAIDESDVCVLVIDANEYAVALDQKIAGLVKQAGKGLIIVVSKWDTIEKDAWTHDILAKKIAHKFQFVGWAPLVFTSAKTGQNVTKVLDLAIDIHNRRGKKIETKELNRFLREVMQHHPPAGLKNKHPKLNYITQTGTYPPEFTFFGSNVEYLHWSYKRYLERELRNKYGFEGTPIKLVFKSKH